MLELPVAKHFYPDNCLDLPVENRLTIFRTSITMLGSAIDMSVHNLISDQQLLRT